MSIILEPESKWQNFICLRGLHLCMVMSVSLCAFRLEIASGHNSVDFDNYFGKYCDRPDVA